MPQSATILQSCRPKLCTKKKAGCSRHIAKHAVPCNIRCAPHWTSQLFTTSLDSFGRLRVDCIAACPRGKVLTKRTKRHLTSASGPCKTSHLLALSSTWATTTTWLVILIISILCSGHVNLVVFE